MDNWEKIQRQKRFRQKNRHEVKKPIEKAPKPVRKIERPRFDPTHWADADEFYEDFVDDFGEADEFD